MTKLGMEDILFVLISENQEFLFKQSFIFMVFKNHFKSESWNLFTKWKLHVPSKIHTVELFFVICDYLKLIMS